MMQARVHGKDLDPSLIYFREMNYEQGNHGATEVPYELRVFLPVFFKAIEGYYQEYAEDDFIYGKKEDDSEILRLRALGWPSLDVLVMKQKSLFLTFLKEHMNYASITLLFDREWKRKEDPLYYINSVDEVTIENDLLVFQGIALS